METYSTGFLIDMSALSIWPTRDLCFLIDSKNKHTILLSKSDPHIRDKQVHVYRKETEMPKIRTLGHFDEERAEAKGR